MTWFEEASLKGPMGKLKHHKFFMLTKLVFQHDAGPYESREFATKFLRHHHYIIHFVSPNAPVYHWHTLIVTGVVPFVWSLPAAELHQIHPSNVGCCQDFVAIGTSGSIRWAFENMDVDKWGAITTCWAEDPGRDQDKSSWDQKVSHMKKAELVDVGWCCLVGCNSVGLLVVYSYLTSLVSRFLVDQWLLIITFSWYNTTWCKTCMIFVCSHVEWWAPCFFSRWFSW